jgi:flagellar hook-associated protein 2
MRLRQLVQSPVYGIKGTVNTLGQLGINFNRNGTLEFDQKKFNAALAKNPEGVQTFFVGDGFSTGFVSSVRREVNNLTNPSFGPITNRSLGLKDKIDQVDKRITDKERQLAKKEEMLRQKFSRLEEQMSKIKAQGAQVGSMGGGNLLPG